MATNKHALIRYKTLDKCFRNIGRRYKFSDLLDEVNNALHYHNQSEGIGVRQLRDDIKFMRSELGYSAPIETQRDGNFYFYIYEDLNFSINNSPLNAAEAEQLKEAISILQRFEGAPQFDWISDIGPMLSNQFGLSKEPRKVISYDTNIDYTGYGYIPELFEAINNRTVLKIYYEPFDKPAFYLTFHPYYLKQYTNRWFVIGLNSELKISTWNLALDRIKQIEPTNLDYIDTNIDWEEYFEDVLGVTVNNSKKPEEIELLFTKEQANYVRTKPIHASQKHKTLETGELHVRLYLIPNYELETKLLSFGEKVKIIKPEYLKKTIKFRIEAAMRQY